MAVRKNLRRQDKDAEQERSVSQERSALGEGIGVLCVTLTIFLGLAFFSYQPDAADSNQVGRAGYLVAHVLCRAFGLTAYLFPVLLLYAMALRFRWLRCAALFVQGVSFVVFTLAASAFLALWFDGRPVFQAGGWGWELPGPPSASSRESCWCLLAPVSRFADLVYGHNSALPDEIGELAGCSRPRNRAVRLVPTADSIGAGCESGLRLARTDRSVLEGPTDRATSPSIRTALLRRG